jgi:hypothetical protein
MSINDDLQAARAMFNPSPIEVIKESTDLSEAKTSKNVGKVIYDAIKSSGVYWTYALPDALNEWEGFLIDYLQSAGEDDVKAVKANIEIVKKMISLSEKLKDMD